MPLTPTNRFVNNSTVTFTPAGGGTAIPITGVKTVTFNPNVVEVTDSGDGDLYPRAGGVYGLDPSITVDSTDAMALSAIAPGAFGTLTWTLNDSRNQAAIGGGAIVFTAANCYLVPQTLTSAYRTFATNSYMFKTLSADGVTNPISTAAA